MAYANKLGVPFAVLLGEDELQKGLCSVKNMASGEQLLLSPDDAAKLIKTTVHTQVPVILEK